MARMPGAIWRPLAANWDQMPRIKAWDIFCLHTMVGSLDGTDGYFRSGNGAGFKGTESHFGTSYDGDIVQWQDTAFQADANYRGGWHIISSENADYGTGFPKWNTGDASQVPAFTDAQVEANAEIAAWLYNEHGIPLDVIPDSKVGRRGMGYHRLGVPGFVVPGGELWSTKAGKGCPGPRRIAQIPLISARAKQLLGGTPMEEDMPTANDVVQALLTFPIEGAGNVRTAIRDTRTIARRAEIAALANGAAIGKLIDVVASGDDITADELKQAITAAMTEAGVTRELIQEAVEAGMAADNAATADEIVDALVERLAGTNPAQ